MIDGATSDLDPSLWGRPPTASQLAVAAKVAADARAEGLATALDGALSLEAAASRLSLTREQVVARVEDGRLIALQDDGAPRLPAWQFGPRRAIHGLEDVIAAWPDAPLSLSIWATTPSPDLDDRTPAEHLARRLSVRRVLELVSALSPAAM
jgi:hypothetical protein